MGTDSLPAPDVVGDRHGRRRSTLVLLAIVMVVAIAALGVTAYRFRARLAAVPAIGSWFAGHEGDTGHLGGAAHSPSPGGRSIEADPRAEVNIDPRRQQLIGVRTATVERSTVTPAVRTVGLVRYDETRLAEINLKLEGWIQDLYVDFTGKLIAKGQPLFTLYSPELVATQNEYLLALRTREQVRESQIGDAREYADRLVESARQRLSLWDLPAEEMRALEQTRQPRTAVVFRSPVSGYVIEKQALQGAHVMPGQMLYKVADLSNVWVEADIYEQDLPLIAVGQPAAVTLDAYPGEQFRGRAAYIYPFVEERTRTVRVRFEFANARSRLKPGMFANVTLQAPAGSGLTVPANALLDSGTLQRVFVAKGGGYFDPRPVRVGRRLGGDRVEILEGLNEGEQVAMGAAFFLDSESQLRAGLQSYEAPPGSAPSEAAASKLNINFRSRPDPARTGDNTFEVTVQDPGGQPIADAGVSVVFFMPAMPTMNMPAMRDETKLPHVGAGVYRGPGQVMTSGRWEVTITVTRGGQLLGRRQLSVVAK
jgi:Cu(I)/Ag(I) efflux system membrane fusion protein/cobalt-zinc-cadmium efflux system membrane fusion protein